MGAKRLGRPLNEGFDRCSIQRIDDKRNHGCVLFLLVISSAASCSGALRCGAPSDDVATLARQLASDCFAHAALPPVTIAFLP